MNRYVVPIVGSGMRIGLSPEGAPIFGSAAGCKRCPAIGPQATALPGSINTFGTLIA